MEVSVQRGEWQLPAPGEFQISGVVECEPKLIGKQQRFAPGPSVGMLVDDDVQQREISQRGAAKLQIDAIPPRGDGQAVGDLQAPEGGNDRASLGDLPVSET